MSAVAAALSVSRPHLSSRQRSALRRRGRPPLPDAGLLAAIQRLIADLPTYGYRRVHALLRRQAEREGRPAPNVKRVYRVMKVHGLLLQRHAGGEERRHEGRIAVDARNTRWCSDGLEIGCDNGERVRVAFALDCCDREAMSVVASTSGITGEDVRDLMVAAVLNTLSIGAFPMRIGATWLVAALLAPGVAYAQNSTKSSCERQAKSICASAVSAHLTGASGDVLLSRGVGFGRSRLGPRWSRATVCWSRRARPRSASARPVRSSSAATP